MPKLLTQTQWPLPVVVVLAALAMIAKNRQWLTADDLNWILVALTTVGTQVGVHTDRPKPRLQEQP